MGTTVILLTEGEPQLAASEQVKHTPGPWKAIADPYEDGTPYFRFEAGEVFDEADERRGFRFDGIMRDPDAHLIAAAPDMLAALKAARPYIKHAASDDLCSGPTRAHETLRQLVAAIAKAEGRTP